MNRSLGKYQQDMYSFLYRYPWSTLCIDRTTTRVMRSLLKRGLIEGNEFGQYRIVPGK